MNSVFIDNNYIGLCKKFSISEKREFDPFGSSRPNDIHLDINELETNKISIDVHNLYNRYPQHIRIKYDNKTFVANNAWVSSSDYEQHNEKFILNCIFIVDDYYTLHDDEIKCIYCTNKSHISHQNTYDILAKNQDRLFILKLIQNLQPQSQAEAIEIIKGHFPNLYKETEKLFSLL